MLEKFQEMLQNLKNKNENELMRFSLDTVQGYFEMEDLNKNLKYNAMNENQLKQTLSFEKHMREIMEKLYIPDLQTENV